MSENIESEITGIDNDKEASIAANDSLVGNAQLPSYRLPATPTQTNGDNYEEIKKAERRHAWLNHEGTGDFINKLEQIRLDKLTKAENSAKIGMTDEAIRYLLQSVALRETVSIITES